MVAEVFSAMIQGIEGQIVKIQVDISNGLPNFNMIGYLSNEVKESKERVRTALNNIGVLLPPKRISVNFAPADFRKCGTSFDIGVAAAILLAMDFVPETYIKDTLFVGELSLNGQICPISGVLPIVVAASKRGIKRCIVAQENVAEAAFVEQMEVIGCRNLEELFFYLKHGYIINDDSGEILENSGNISEDSGKECTIQDVKKSQEISESTRSLNLKSTVLVKDILENNAEILGDARIGGKAQIYGKAKVMRGVVVHANAEILGDAQIQGVVNISQDARICSDEDYAAVQGFRTKFKFATFYRAKDEKVMVYCGDFNGNLEGFREWAKKTFDGKNQKEYLTIADFMEQHFAPEKEED